MHYRYGRMICKNALHKDMQGNNAMIDMQYIYAIKKCKTDVQYRYATKIFNTECNKDMQ